jgi:hypothetical protein
MRGGPGQKHGAVAQIPAGAGGIKFVGPCQWPDDHQSRYQWCKFQWRGTTGWISSNGLEEETVRAAPTPPPRQERAPEPTICQRGEFCLQDCTSTNPGQEDACLRRCTELKC